MPRARPTMLASASGELNTRSCPYFRCKPEVALKTPPFPAILRGFCANSVAFEWVRPIALANMQPRKSAHQLGNAPPRCLYFDRYRNRVAVVFDQIQQRQLLRAGYIEGFPKLAFARRSIAARHVHNLIALVPNVFAQRRFLRLRERLGASLVILCGFRRPDRLQELRSRA